MSFFKPLGDWKQFERLCADLLEAEGFVISSEPSIDTGGVDFVATEQYRSHDQARTLSITWRVQCKYHESNVSRPDVEAALNSYLAVRRPDEGLLFITTSDYTEPALRVIGEYRDAHAGARTNFWNRRHLLARLYRHPELLRRYGLTDEPAKDYLATLGPLSEYSSLDVLLISDQSPLAHDLASALRATGNRVTFIPVWNYQYSSWMLEKLRLTHCDLVLVFVGDSFEVAMPRHLQRSLSDLHGHGAGVMLFPFTAWSQRAGLLLQLTSITPVSLMEAGGVTQEVYQKRFPGEFRKGDFSSDLLLWDSFVEDRYMELDPATAEPGWATGIERSFGLSHSFEVLQEKPGATVAWRDSTGNPFIVTMETETGRVCYVNSCCHSCVSVNRVPSPLEVSDEFGLALLNAFRWLLDGSVRLEQG